LKIGGMYERPSVGYINVNTDKFTDFEKMDDIRKIELRRTFFHEMTHALAFSSSLYPKYIDIDGKLLSPTSIVEKITFPNKRVYTTIVHKKMKKTLREYFNCENPRGFPLDLNGNAHFLQQLVADTIMRPIAEDFDDRISVFMLTLFDITGWYMVDYSKQELTLFGKGKGCDYIDLKCTNPKTGQLFEEYCDENNTDYNCDFYYNSISKCLNEETSKTKPKEKYGNTCSYLRPKEGSKCTAKANNKCLRTLKKSVYSAECFEAKCDKTNKSIIITVGGKTNIINYSTGSPSSKSIKVDDKEILAPDSYERFCFYQENPQPQDKLFRK
jgi:Leishmanolysin